jgi:hypothetical protein
MLYLNRVCHYLINSRIIGYARRSVVLSQDIQQVDLRGASLDCSCCLKPPWSFRGIFHRTDFELWKRTRVL